MGKQDKSTKWFVRVDVNRVGGIACAGVMEQWIDLKRLLMAHHMGEKGENPHVHFVIELASEIQKQSFDVRLKKVFTVETRSQYSSKIWDGRDECCSYLFHECDDCIVHNKGFTEDEINRFRALNKSVQNVIAVNKDKASCRAPERAIAHFGTSDPSRREVLEWFLLEIKQGRMYEPGDWQMAKYVEEVVMKCTADDNWSWYVDSRYKKIFRDQNIKMVKTGRKKRVSGGRWSGLRRRQRVRKVMRSGIGKAIQPVQYFKRTRYYPASLTIASGATSYQGVSFTLGDIPDVTDFTALYDQYKILALKVQWLPRGNSSDVANQGSISRMFSVIDRDDDATPSSIDQLCQYESLKVTPTTQVHKRYFKPSIRREIATGLGTTGSEVANPQWIDVTNTNVKHYGLKLAIQGPTPVGLSITYDAMVTFYMAFKNVR